VANLEAEQLWDRVLTALAPRLNDETIRALLRPLSPLDASRDALGGVFMLQAPNDFSRDWVARSYEGLITDELRAITGHPWTLCWSLAPDGVGKPASPPAPRRSTPAAAQRRPQQAARSSSLTGSATHPSEGRAARAISSGLHPRYTFENFVSGPSNALAHAAALSMVDFATPRVNPLFLFGGTGLGKTHLANAVGHRLLELRPSARVVYVSAEHFMNEFVTSVRTSLMSEFRERYRNGCDALLIDDVQFLDGKQQTQEEFFHTFNSLFQNQKPIVLTSDVPPQQLQGIPERLVSRFSSGLVADISPPELETRMAILRKKAASEGISLTDEAALLLANGIVSNVRDLEATLMRLAIKASLSGRLHVDGVMVAEALRLPVRRSVSTIEDVQRVVGEHYRVRVNQLTGQGRQREITLPRQVAMFICREYLAGSLPQIGDRFGGRDHTTVLSAVRKIRALVDQGDAVAQVIDAVTAKLGLVRL